jgi:integrase
MKTGKPFTTPLSGLAVELLRPYFAKAVANPEALLFEIPRSYKLHGAVRRIVVALKMERWTPHDLRRTAGSILARKRHSEKEVGKLLAHDKKTVTGIYMPWDHIEVKVEMAGVIDRVICEAIADEPVAAAAA